MSSKGPGGGKGRARGRARGRAQGAVPEGQINIPGLPTPQQQPQAWGSRQQQQPPSQALGRGQQPPQRQQQQSRAWGPGQAQQPQPQAWGPGQGRQVQPQQGQPQAQQGVPQQQSRQQQQQMRQQMPVGQVELQGPALLQQQKSQQPSQAPGAQQPSRGRARGIGRGVSPEVAPGIAPTAASVIAAGGQVSRGQYRGADRPLIGGVTEQMGAMQISAEGSNGSATGDSGNGNGAARSVGRAMMRGRREISRILTTKPATCTMKRGTQGQAINLVTNFFNLEKKHDWKLCLYHVDFSPDEDRTRERKKMMRQHREALGEEYLFDGMQLYMSKKLPNETTEFASKREDDNSVYQIKLKFIKELDGLDSQYLQIMNIILRRCQEYLGLTLLGRNYFDSKAEERWERYRIKIWPGYTTSIRQHENRLLLNCDIAHKFLRADTAYNAFENLRGDWKSEVQKKLLGCIVMTTYNEKTYRIDDIDFDLNPKSKFPYKGGEITYMEYYQTNYQVRIRDERQPLLLSKPKKRDLRRGMSGNIYLIPELCMMTGLTDDMRSNFNMMKDLACYMRMAPDKRVEALMKFNNSLSRNEEVRKELNNWGLRLAPALQTVQGRMLPNEEIIIGGGNVKFDRNKSDWSMEMRSKRLNDPKAINNWAVLCLSRMAQDANSLVQTLSRVGPPMGMQFARPEIFQLQQDSAQAFISEISSRCQGKQLVLCILPNNRADRYAAIKKHLAVKMGIPSQCVLAKTLSKPQRLMSIATKIAIQINCKLGGEPWGVAIPLKGTLVIGYDAYHDKLTRGASYGAVVSSINQDFTVYMSQVAKHSNQEELSDNFTTGIKNALNHYQQVNRDQPKTVIVYRDGVGEGQLEYVKEHEIQSIRKCFAETLQQEPKFAFVVVSKRINARVMIQTGRNNFGNPPPGTVVDDEITLPERYDFYLVSQSVNQGTVSPTSFNVIEDTTNLKPDHHQRLAYKLTHLYYNWQGTVRVPAPCMYAHKLAFMTGQYVNQLAHRNLMDTLWYL